jgi:two-component system, chemotaxis family, response regulator Rcp1
MKRIKILLIEDNPGDVRLIIEALTEARLNNQIMIARNGEEGLTYLYKSGKNRRYPKPDMVLLDLNLPGVDGREVLKTIKSDPNLMRIPVIVFTTSSAEEDILRAYDLNANAYVTKPIDINDFFKVIRVIENFWLEFASLPPLINK